MGICPAIYTTFRTYLIGQLPNEWSYTIAGQLSWVNLIYEVISEALILPLFYFMGKVVKDEQAFTNRLRTGMCFTGILYTVFATGIILTAVPMLQKMAISPDIIPESAVYIRIESIAYIFQALYSFALTALITIGESRYVYILTGCKMALTITADIFLVSVLPVSFRLGVTGIGVSNIITGILLCLICVLLLKKKGYNIFKHAPLSYEWMKELGRVGGLSGLESLIRNLAYMVMVVRMVNVVNEQGVYWVANNFIWGWLLLPVLQLAELIKQESATEKDAVKDKSRTWFTITGCICLMWVIFIPLYKPFMRYILGYTETDKLFQLVMILLIPYIFFAFQNVCDAVFYGKGKTNYMFLEAVITNVFYYGTAFIVYKMGIWRPTLTSIAVLFGLGNIFDSIVTWILFMHYMSSDNRKESKDNAKRVLK